MGKEIKNEKWVDIVGYEGYYMISSLGVILTLARVAKIKNGTRAVKEGIKRTNISPFGYERVQLSRNGISKEFFVHRLSLISFIGYENGRPHVNHKNGIRSDNRLENLEWCTPSENALHSINFLNRALPKGCFKKGREHILYGKGHLKPQCKKVHCSTLDISFGSIREAARKLGINNANICSVLKGRYLHTEGLIFRYL